MGRVDPDLGRLRTDRVAPRLRATELAPTWTEQFRRWFAEARDAGLPEPNAMALATVDAGGDPGVRVVLCRQVDEAGFVFYTHHGSPKGRALAVHPRAAAVFAWLALARQVTVAGPVEVLDRASVEEYFASRPRGSQLGAWASEQSAVIADRAVLDERLRELAKRWPPGMAVPTPPFWGGYRIRPQAVEFWAGQPDRLHDRLRYRMTPDGTWVTERLAP